MLSPFSRIFEYEHRPMTEKELKLKYSEIGDFLARRKLKPAFDLLENIIRENGLGNYYDEYRTLEQTYHYMLRYTVEGIRDPERQKVYRHLIVSAFELADEVNESLRRKYSLSFEYEKKRLHKNPFVSGMDAFLSDLEEFYLQQELKSLVENTGVITGTKERLTFQEKLVQLFYHFWFCNKLTPEEKDFLKSFFESGLIEVHYKGFMVSALHLSVQRFFDESKFSLLFDLYGMPQEQISQRALIVLLAALYRYDARLPFYPQITGRLEILNESPGFKRNLERVILQFIRSRETEKIQKKIKDEIIPEMIRISPNLKDKINLDSLMEEGWNNDKNPEWEEIFRDSPGLIDKMEEFSRLQMEGADVFIGSFAMLKMFPFFGEFTNWFMPFFPENPEIGKGMDMSVPVNRQFVKTIYGAPVLCNSDKYSFCLSIQNLPQENREFIAQGMKTEMEQLNELENDEEVTDPGRLTGFISNQYIQDLYRFYKLHPRRSGFEDIFNWSFDFHNRIILGNILREDVKVLRNLAEYYFSKNYFPEAAGIFNELLMIEKNGELYQKAGFCYLETGDYEQALEAYLKAELYELNRSWNLKKIALCYRNLKKPEKALEYYRLAEKLEPENLNIQLSIGHCLLELQMFDEALKCYFKVEYLSPGNKKVWRPIAWCSFVTGKKEQALKYYLKLMEHDPGKHDFMNMGHVQWSLGDRKSALEYYKKSISQAGFAEREFFEVFDEDLHHLLRLGIENEDVPIMLDQLRYFLEE